MRKYLLIALILFIGKVNAQQIITDRPDQTESSSTVPKGSLQIESGLLLSFIEANSETERQLLAPTTLFRYGLTTGIEIRVLNQFENIKNIENSNQESGISDLEIGTKIQVLQKENINTEIAFLSHLIIPTGSKSLTNDRYGSINKISVSHSINKNIGIGYNGGYNYFGTGKGDLTYSLVLGIGISKKVGIYIETYGSVVEFENHESNFDTGFTYLLKDNFQLDFSFGTGINYTMNYISIGFSWNIRNA
ncbi:MAG: hypothetical protein GQ525_12665 [Draconibacterium sp.]|nr:hypothetical protein [Draconibacterium sp.]